MLRRIAGAFAEVEGVAAVVLGGSRARGTHHPGSDYDIGLYYEDGGAPAQAALEQAARRLDPSGTVTPVGAWGRWMDGGGWLTVEGTAVDVLYRSLGKLERVIAACRSGEVEIAYQPGHPHGFLSAIYAGEAAYGRALHDPSGRFGALQRLALPYPPALRQALVARFQWESGFSLANGAKAVARPDASYVAGCMFRTVACLMQVLFAVNERYLLNEKGAIAAAAMLPHRPERLAERVEAAFAALGRGEAGEALALLEPLNVEIEGLAG